MPVNPDDLKHECEFVAEIRLKKVAVLNYLGEGTASNQVRVEKAMRPRGTDGVSRATKVLVESRTTAMKEGSIFASRKTVRHIGRLTRDNKAGQCDQIACAIVEELIGSDVFKDQRPRVEILGNGGHAFVVVNRQEGSSLNDIRNWGEAILIDVWKFNQGLSKHPVSWTAESPDLSAWAAAGAIKELFSLEELDWDLIQFTS